MQQGCHFGFHFPYIRTGANDDLKKPGDKRPDFKQARPEQMAMRLQSWPNVFILIFMADMYNLPVIVKRCTFISKNAAVICLSNSCTSCFISLF